MKSTKQGAHVFFWGGAMILRRFLFAAFAITLAALWTSVPGRAQNNNLIPQPAKLTPGDGRLEINGDFRVALAGYQEGRLQAAALRLIARLAKQTGIPFSDVLASDPGKATLVIRCDHASKPVQLLGEDESYQLEVTSAQALLTAANPLGVLRGMETFLQLVELDEKGFRAPAVRVEDHPRFAWRGLMIDSARHWMPVEVMKRNLDGMAALKLNVLHWHLADDQGFRVESKEFPKLQEMGSDGHYYTQDQVREIIAYARERGIRVVPEFDMPGHTTAWVVGYPELASAPGPYSLERKWGIFDPTLDPTREEVYKFLDGFIGEMAALFPDEYFHVGGDEVNGKQWDANPRIQSFLREHGLKNNHELQTYFTRRVQAIVQKHGKKMIGWDEVLHPDLPKDIVIQSWRGQKSLAEAARQGYRGLLSAGYYLDLIYSAASHYAVDPMEGATAGLSPEEQARILGGEACMWSEYVSPETVDSRIWPRMAAIAERLWSLQSVKDVDSMYRRLEVVSRNLEGLGLTHRSSFPQMLGRLVGETPPTSLQTLSGLLEPVKEYSRGEMGEYTSFTPLNRLVDATRPESDAARGFAKLVENISANREQIRQQLTHWRDGQQTLVPLLQRSFLSQEDVPLSEDVAALSQAGLEALDYVEAGKHAPENWLNEQQALLDRAAKPRAELLIMIVPSIRKLVEAAR
ncbi:MAG: family 20 glycosylhydrolase [Acidobacteriia bacterium]|nr:family 20 glycosylhydrolase [Terriglobia bacterium]